MDKIDSSPYIISAPLNLRNLLITLYVYLDKFIVYFTGSYKLLKFIRKLFLTSLLFFLHLLSFFYPNQEQEHAFNLSENVPYGPQPPPHKVGGAAASSSGSDIAVARALSQILSIINNIPVTSGKYEVIRALFEKLIEENRKVDSKALREVNRVVLSTAFARTLGLYEAALKEESSAGNCGGVDGLYANCMQVVSFAWSRVGRVRKEGTRTGSSAEKMAAELLWLGQKLAAFGFAEEAVMRWASASKLAKLSVSIEPRLQVSLLKVSAFIFKQSSELGKEETELSKKEQKGQMKMDMLMSWLPFLCRVQNGIEAPVLSITERVELERILEEIIDELGSEWEQEKVLSLWLHHFMYSPSSDWPDLQKSYKRWFNASRKLWI